MTPLHLLNTCPDESCSIEHMDYYRCQKCGREVLVRTGDEPFALCGPSEDIRDDVRAAYGWVTPC